MPAMTRFGTFAGRIAAERIGVASPTASTAPCRPGRPTPRPKASQSASVTGTISAGIINADVNGTPAVITGTDFTATGVRLAEGLNTSGGQIAHSGVASALGAQAVPVASLLG